MWWGTTISQYHNISTTARNLRDTSGNNVCWGRGLLYTCRLLVGEVGQPVAGLRHQSRRFCRANTRPPPRQHRSWRPSNSTRLQRGVLPRDISDGGMSLKDLIDGFAYPRCGRAPPRWSDRSASPVGYQPGTRPQRTPERNHEQPPLRNAWKSSWVKIAGVGVPARRQSSPTVARAAPSSPPART